MLEPTRLWFKHLYSWLITTFCVRTRMVAIKENMKNMYKRTNLQCDQKYFCDSKFVPVLNILLLWKIFIFVEEYSSCVRRFLFVTDYYAVSRTLLLWQEYASWDRNYFVWQICTDYENKSFHGLKQVLIPKCKHKIIILYSVLFSEWFSFVYIILMCEDSLAFREDSW